MLVNKVEMCSVYDILGSERFSILSDYDIEFIDDYTVVVISEFDNVLIKFLESSKMIYDVIKGDILVYLAHPAYRKSRIKELKNYTALCESLLKFRILDLIFEFKNKNKDCGGHYIEFFKGQFMEDPLFVDYISVVWEKAFKTLPIIEQVDDFVRFTVSDQPLLEAPVDDQQESV